MEQEKTITFEEYIIRKFADSLITVFQTDPELDKPVIDYNTKAIEQTVKKYLEKDRKTGVWKHTMEENDRRTKELVPDADPMVLQFITDFTCHSARCEGEYEVIHDTFRAGYCWHFAHLLKTTFDRGEVCWAAPFGHFVWVDDNGIPYDIEGANCGEQIYNIPESYVGKYIKEFTHIPGKNIRPSTAEDIISFIRAYEDDRNLPHADLSYYHLQDNDYVI